MIISILFTLLAGQTADPVVTKAITTWEEAVEKQRAKKPPAGATTSQVMHYLISLDEVTRQNSWVMDTPGLTSEQQRQIGAEIGPKMNAIDDYTTAELKRIVPKNGWFSNSMYGKQITHGAWLIAQHSSDTSFMNYVLEQMKSRVTKGDVDGKDFALIYDRVKVYQGLPQRYGSQFACRDGLLTLEPIEELSTVDAQREKIGWSQTLAETLGDNEIGKPCAQ
ncbi:DUF6624 domain-containing protein [Sphingomonas oryzagri]